LQILEKFWEQDDLANYLNTAQNFLILDANTAYQTFTALEVAIEAMRLPGRPVRHVMFQDPSFTYAQYVRFSTSVGISISAGTMNYTYLKMEPFFP